MHQITRLFSAKGFSWVICYSLSKLAPCNIASDDLQGYTALYYAAHRSTNGTVGTVMSAGADTNIASFTICGPA